MSISRASWRPTLALAAASAMALAGVEHQKAFDFRRDEWIDTIHRWFDYWLQGVDNGIVAEPRADVDKAPHEWLTHADWPNGKVAHLWLGRSLGSDATQPGTLWPDARHSVLDRTVRFREARASQAALVANPLQQDDRRVVFVSPVLSEPVHISGETRVTVQTKIGGQNATFSAFLVDYGTAERINHTGGGTSGGILGLPGSTCFGQGTDVDTGCYPNVTLRTHTANLEVVTRGWAHAAFQLGGSPLDPGTTYELTWNLQHHDYVFEAGHRIGLVISGPETRLASGRHPTTNNQVEIRLGQSRVELPVVGGAAAIRAAFQ